MCSLLPPNLLFPLLRHAVLPNAILRNASVQAHDFSLTSKLSGLAFFDKNGRLSAVDSIKLSESGRPVFDQMDSDLDMKGNKLTNSIVINSVLENIINASIFNLKLTPYSSNIHEEDSVAVFVDGYVRSTGKAASITQTGHLKVASIGNFKMAGDIVGDGHNIFGAVLSGDKSSVANVNSVSTKSLRITSLQAPSQDISKPHRILVANHDGDVTTMSDGDSASGLRLSRLSIASGLTLDGPFTMSEHQELKAGNIIGNKGSFSSIAVKGSLVLAEDALSRANAPTGHGSQRILTVDTASGTVGAIGGVHIDNDGFLRFEHEGIAATSVRAGKLTLSGLDKAPEGVGTQTVLVVDKSGSVRAADGLSVSTIHAEGLAVTGSAHVKNLRVEALSGSGLVFADSSGDLSVVRTTDLDNLNVFAVDVSGSITAKKITLTDGVGSGGLLSVNAAGVVSVNQPVVVETIEVKQAKFSDVVIGSKITLSGLGETGDAAYLLSVDNNGVVTASKDASMNDLRAQNIAVSGVASVKSLAASNLRHSSESNLIVQADRDGHLVATANIISSMISAESITVEKSVKAGGLSITGLTLAGGALTDLLTANSDGVVSTTTGLNVNSLLTHSLTSSEVTITGSLLLSGVASPGYLTVGAAGEVSSSAALVAALATVEKLQVGETMTNSMHILGLSGAGGSLLSVDEVGKVQLSSEVKIAKVSVGTTATKELEVLGRVSLNGLSRSESEVGEILYRTEAGDIAVTDSALLTSVTATTLRVPGRAFFSGSVFIQDMPLGLLSIGNGGQVQSSANIHLPEGGIMRTPSAQIDESLTLNGKLEMIGNRYQVFDPKMEFNEVLAFPLGLNRADGAVEVMTSLVGLRELSAQNVTVKGSLTTDSLRIEGVSELGRPAVLSVGSNGLVLASSTIDVEIIYASTVEVSGSLSAADVVLDSLKVVPPGTLLCSKENGKFGPVDSASVLKTTSIAVEGDLSVSGRLQLTSIKPGVAVVDEGGLIASSGDVALDSLRVGKAATINEMTVLGSITMPGMSAVNKPLQGVMTLDGAALAFTRQLSLDAVTAKDLTVGGRASLDKVTIGTLTKENSGLLVVSSGEVGVTSDIAVQQMTATRLTVVEIRPPDKSGVAVVDARLSGRTILEEGAKITKAASIETNTLSVLSGPTFFRGAIDIEGNLDVRGHVMGSGPYHDSSDHRFKTNVTEVHGALAKVRALKPVSAQPTSFFRYG